ncbi:hypothetical protein [Sphingomonas mali]|uniref:hypothetical protein n=1 Tax=Sphingomonas mali TaxID=40682 RepID=UPI000830190B|nr:hypothetical protein [Sphingomonas mali]
MSNQNDKDFSVLVIASAIRAIRELQSIIDIAGTNDETKEKHKNTTGAAAAIIFDIMDTLVVPTEAAYPELKEEMHRRISLFGRCF